MNLAQEEGSLGFAPCWNWGVSALSPFLGWVVGWGGEGRSVGRAAVEGRGKEHSPRGGQDLMLGSQGWEETQGSQGSDQTSLRDGM